MCRLNTPNRVSRATRKIAKVHTLKPLHSSETVNKVEKLQLLGEKSKGMMLDWLELIGSDPSKVTISVNGRGTRTHFFFAFADGQRENGTLFGAEPLHRLFITAQRRPQAASDPVVYM